MRGHLQQLTLTAQQCCTLTAVRYLSVVCGVSLGTADTVR